MKYCATSSVTCASIESEMIEGVDQGNMSEFRCYLGAQCGVDRCNELVPVRVPGGDVTSRPDDVTTYYTTSSSGGERDIVVNEIELAVEEGDGGNTVRYETETDEVSGSSGALKRGLVVSVTVLVLSVVI